MADPTYDEIREAIAEGVCSTGSGVVEGIDEAAQNVVALLSRSAAEPPPFNRFATTIDSLLERVDAWVESVEGTPSPWALVGDMADLLRRLRGVAAEPKEHGDGR